jgi:hypothetical protein
MFKVSQATLIDLGLVGPKARLKSVTDGQQVNIPVQLVFRQSNTGTMSIPISGTSVPEKGILKVKVALAQG